MKKKTLRMMQNQIAASNAKRFTVSDLKSIEDNSESAIVDDVKRLMEANEHKVPIDDMVIIQLRNVIVKGSFHELIIKKCGKASLVFILKKSMIIRRKNKSNTTKTLPKPSSLSEQLRQKKAADAFLWEQQTEQKRFQIRSSLTPQKMREIYFKLKDEKKKTTDYLRIESNTSQYAIEAVENGDSFSTYHAARLVYFLLTNGDINDTKYYYSPMELFVDYLAGKSFSYVVKRTKQNHRPIDNPKACGLPIYLKK